MDSNKAALRLFDKLIEGEVEYIDDLIELAIKKNSQVLDENEFNRYIANYKFAKAIVLGYQDYVHKSGKN